VKKIIPIKGPLRGEFVAPADKSIGHRAAILSAISQGEARISNFPGAQDCHSTLSSLRTLGVDIEESGSEVRIFGRGIAALQSPSQAVDCGNSGTTARFLSGVISSVDGLRATLDGDSSLRKRPMARVAKPLQQMGAVFHGSMLPMSIEGKSLQAIDWFDDKSSAQVKSAILLAGLSAKGSTMYHSALESRDHTERMMRFLGATVSTHNTTVSITPGPLTAKALTIPGDASGAAFLLGAAVLTIGSLVKATRVCLNPTRMGFYRVLRQMGAQIFWQEEESSAGEPIGNIVAKSSALQGLRPPKEEVPSMIDELPLLAVIATQADGETLVEGAAELRVKESDRIAAICENLTRMGANIEALPDGFRVKGPTPLHGAEITSFDDHRIAMAMSVAALIAEGDSQLDKEEVVSISFPGFFTVLDTFK
jgi:3-phosphoshikimate 1-carboxyvinyltransferase